MKDPTTSPDYGDFIEFLREEQPALARELSAFTGITSVLTWMQKRGLSRTAVDIIGQDEFHYDFLIRYSGKSWLAFGVT